MRKTKLIFCYLLICLGQIVAQIPALTHKYLRPDDFHHLYASIAHSGKYITMAIAQGRLFNILHHYLFQWLGSTDLMTLVRAISLVGTILLAFCIFNTFKRYGENIFLSVLFTLFITLLPAFREFTGFTVMFLAPWGVIMAFLAFRCLEKAIELQFKQKILWSFLAVILLVLAYNIFPPSATFISFFICLYLLYSKSEKKLQNTFFFLLIGALGTLTHFIIYKLYLVLLSTPTLERTGLLENPTEKITWFISEPLNLALNLINLYPKTIAAVTVGLVIFFGLTTYLWKHKSDTSIFVILLILAILYSYSSNLIIAENVATHRTLVGLSAIFALLFLFAIKNFLVFIKKTALRDIFSYTIFSGLALLAVICSFYYLQITASRYALALNQFEIALDDFDAQKHHRIVLTYNDEKEHNQALIHLYYPDAIHIILNENRQGFTAPITIRAGTFEPLMDDYIIPIGQIASTQKEASVISAKYVEEE